MSFLPFQVLLGCLVRNIHVWPHKDKLHVQLICEENTCLSSLVSLIQNFWRHYNHVETCPTKIKIPKDILRINDPLQKAWMEFFPVVKYLLVLRWSNYCYMTAIYSSHNIWNSMKFFKPIGNFFNITCNPLRHKQQNFYSYKYRTKFSYNNRSKPFTDAVQITTRREKIPCP